MTVYTAGSPTFALTVRDRVQATDRNGASAAPSRTGALLEALAYVSALVDPSGVLAVQRLRHRQHCEQRGGRGGGPA